MSKFYSFGNPLSYSNAQMALQEAKIHNLLISIGEHRDINPKPPNFTVGNKDIISYKVSHVLRNILIKEKTQLTGLLLGMKGKKN